VAGSDAESTLNAALELFSSVICNAEVPVFLIEIFCDAPVPTFTSPKSTKEGLATTASGDENGREFDPHPVRPAPTSREQPRTASAYAFSRKLAAFEERQSWRTADLCVVFKEEEMRVLFIIVT
jgi:hypothetical protein